MNLENLENYLIFFVSGFLIATILWFAFSFLQGNVLWARVFQVSDPMSKTIPILSVTNETGIVGSLSIKAVSGNGDVLIKTNPFIETDIQYSANVALEVARVKTNSRTPSVDFIISYNIPASSISGPSGGAALAAAAIALLDNKTIRKDIAVTGSIRPDGKIGSVGGIMLKTEAAAKAGYKKILIPEWQSVIVNIINKGTKQVSINGTMINIPNLEREIINLTEYGIEVLGIEVIEVTDIDNVTGIMLD